MMPQHAKREFHTVNRVLVENTDLSALFALSQPNISTNNQDCFGRGQQIKVRVTTVPSGKLLVRPRLLHDSSSGC